MFSRIFIDRPIFAWVIAIITMLAGIGGILALPVEQYPDIAPTSVNIRAQYPGASAETLESSVTQIIEQQLTGIDGLIYFSATSNAAGSVNVTVTFEKGTDPDIAQVQVQNKVQQALSRLPQQVQRQGLTVTKASADYLMVISIYDQTDRWSNGDIADYLVSNLQDVIGRLNGVGDVNVFGSQHAMRIWLDPNRLASYSLMPSDIVSAIEAQNTQVAAGQIGAMPNSDEQMLNATVTARSRFTTPEQFRKILVKTQPDGSKVLLENVARVELGNENYNSINRLNGHPAAGIGIQLAPGADALKTSRLIRDELTERAKNFPSGLTYAFPNDSTAFIKLSVEEVIKSLVEAIILVVIVMFVFLQSWRATLIPAIAVPVVLLGTFGVLAVAGYSINTLTLFGLVLAIGLLVDDAIVVVENISRHSEKQEAQLAARAGLAEVLPPLTGSSLATIVIFLPFALLSGIAGAFFRPLALTIALALGVSYFLSGFAIPAFVDRLRLNLRHAPRRRAPRPPRLARFFIAHPSLAVAVTLALLAGGVALYAAIGSDFLPAMDEGSIILDYWTPPGTSLTDTDAMLQEVERIIVSLPDVQSYSRRTGEQLGFFVTEPNTGDYVIRLKPRGSRRGVDEVIDDLRERIAKTEPAIRADFGQILEDNIYDLAGGVPQPVDVRIYGEDQSLLQQKARRAADILRKVPGVVDVFDGITISGPKLYVVPRLEALARFGMTPEALHSEVEPALGGTVAGRLRIGERLYDIRVFSRPAVDVPGLPRVRILTPSGAAVPLSDLATVSTGAPDVEIQRENLRTYLGVTARLDNVSLGQATADIQRRLAAGLALPPAMSLRYAGLYEQQQSSFKGLLGVLFGGLLLVSVIVLFQFGDWRAAVLTALIAIAVLTSVLGSLIVTGMTLNVSSFVGAIMMVGIVGEKSVFLIHDARDALHRGVPVAEAWAEASHKRLRAVMMTIFATAFALAPLAFALGEGSQLQQPLAIAVIGGFILSSPLVLLILPSLYRWLDPKGKLGIRHNHG